MKKSKINFLIILIIIVIIMGISGYILILKNDSTSVNSDDVINISECSEEFMNNYFDEMREIQEIDNKDNILIVTSKNKIKDGYGASKIVEAPNNQYFIQYDSAELKNAAFNRFKNDDSVISTDQNEMVTFDETNYNSWGIEKMALDTTINILTENSYLQEVNVAIIDTGCDVDLVNKYYQGKIKETYNVLTDSSEDMTDTYGHGTHIAGTIAEGTPSNVKIIPIKVSTGERQYVTDILDAINYIVYYKKADVINMSFGMYAYNTALYNAIESANQENIISVAASGNDNTSSKHYPAAFNNTISIASVDSELKKSSFSNYGSTIDFTAPGTNIKSTLSKNMLLSDGNVDGDDDFETISGTSMATPHAVNAVAILKSYNKNLTKNNVIKLLKDYAVKDLGNAGKDIYYGYGFIYLNPESFSLNPEEDNCEEFGIFKASSKISISEFEAQYVARTSKNYGTVNNFNPTQIKLTYSNGASTTAILGDLSGVEIIGYDPYEIEEQIITIKWQGMQTSFKFTNPIDWESGWIYEVIDSRTAKITGFTDFNFGNYKTKKLYIPEKIDGYIITDIANDTFGNSVFSSASISSYEEIILPSTLTEISGFRSFAGFSFVEKVTSLASSMKITGNNVFSDDISLVEITGTITHLGKNTFKNDISLQNIALSDSVTEIPEGTFNGCTSLTDIILPESLKIIGDYAFHETGIVEVVLPNSVEILGSYAFRQTNNRTTESVTLSSNLKSIGDFALAGTLITEIYLPDSLETIGRNAFASTKNLKSFYLPKNVISLGTDLFIYCSSLETIIVDKDNRVYDSRNNCNAIIETATNTLLCGASKTVIPDTIEKIGDNSFYYIEIEELTIPESVTEIGKYVFYGAPIEKLYIPSSVDTIGESAFIGKDKKFITIWTNTEAYAKTYAVENKVPYESINLSYINTSLEDFNFSAFDTVDAEIYVFFDRGVNSGSSYKEWKKIAGRQETIDSSHVEIIYQDNRDSFRYGDTLFTIRGVTQYGENFEKTFDITVLKATPTYEIPTNLTANLGQSLSEIQLPSGFEWMDNSQVINKSGKIVYKAKYIPIDTANYNTVENIDIEVLVSTPNPEKPVALTIEGTYTYNGENQKVNVLEFDSNTMEISGDIQSNSGTYTITVTSKTGRWNDNTTTPVYGEWTINKQEITPEIEIEDKVFDNTKDIDKNTITISNLDNTEYSIESAVLNSINVGNTTANVIIKLTDDKYQNYTLSNNNQEFSYTVNVCVIAAKELDNILITKSPNKTTYLVGENFDSTGMEVTAHYTDNSTRVIDNYEIINSNNLSYGVDEVIIIYSEDGITKETTQNINVLDNTIIRYKTHVQNDGWQNWKTQGQMSGTEGRSLRLEGICINLENNVLSGSVKYSTHIQNIGWQEEKVNGQMSGTEGQSLRLEAIKIKLEGNISQYYDIYYRVHAQNFGWLGWAKNGEAAGTAGYAYRLEGIEIVLSRKETQFEGNTINCFKQNIQYRTHVQDIGWQDYVNSGEMSGTSGRSLRLEGIIISLNNTDVSGNLEYRTHVQNIGWQGWVNNSQMSGTSGQSLRLEAIQIKLTGRLAEKYDIYYRVHCQNFGWLGWAKNGESSGTEGYSYRLEGIEIKLVDKNENVPLNGEAFYKNR